MPLSTTLNKAFTLWKDHNSATRSDTDLAVCELLREAHPGFHVTRTDTSSCSLISYAEAGFATATLDTNNSYGYDATRKFVSPRRLDKRPGSLQDKASFARWLYKWEGKEFVVYQAAYQNDFGRRSSSYYVLSQTPEADKLVNGCHHADTDALLRACGEWTKELHEEVEIFDDGRWQKSTELYKSMKGASWDEVILEPTMKANLMQDVQEFFDNRDIYASLNVPWKRGVILHGFPGNGKTISIKALINSLAARPDPIPSLYVKAFDSCNGPKWSIRSVFEHARSMSPCLLIFEDLDSMVEAKVRSYFLNEVDGLESNEGILMIGSTNHLNKLDPAISKRPSRFDRKYHFKLPDEPERAAYCQWWAKKFVGSDTLALPDELCEYIAKLTPGFSFAYLKELFVTSLLAVARGANVGSEETDAESSNEDAASSGGLSEAVVVERVEAQEKEEKDGEAASEAKEDKKTAAKKPKLVIPEVEVPESLRGSMLPRIFKAQAKSLIDEMDNSEDDDEADKEKKKEKVGAVLVPGVVTGTMRAVPAA
ncbi:P-loop containing nucleoside triphosphate hydrolase protein [Thozetella sp. PMI_491]|nr:P-loop containing nucleoside triphosphate hydrolase protein [Thozetella sp. PMI_491]